MAAPRSLLAFWLGGASAAPAPATQAGYRSMLAPWLGGASVSSAPTTQAGFRGLMAFWMGGGAPGGETAIAPDWIVLARRRGRR